MIRSSALNLIVLIVVSVSKDAYAFTSFYSRKNQQFARGSILSRATTLTTTRNRSFHEKYLHGNDNPCRIYLMEWDGADDMDNDDNGWDDEVGEDNSESPLDRKSDRGRELAMLREALAINRGGQRSFDSGAVKGGGDEKDLFIPIVTLVSVIGFTGLYGYEMLRLYSRGELYLPWEK